VSVDRLFSFLGFADLPTALNISGTWQVSCWLDKAWGGAVFVQGTIL